MVCFFLTADNFYYSRLATHSISDCLAKRKTAFKISKVKENKTGLCQMKVCFMKFKKKERNKNCGRAQKKFGNSCRQHKQICFARSVKVSNPLQSDIIISWFDSGESPVCFQIYTTQSFSLHRFCRVS